ncbi:MAG TPA: acyclic terpene utilization AtuA family protein, partial [Aliiroseovarius sp.]|nr:acyclic terpene utilization AtuA family protein [Aliiroseovarius sp.]
WLLDITREIADGLGQSLKIAVLKSSQPSARIQSAFANGHVSALPNAPEISAPLIESCTNIVALAGAEHIQAALETGADIIIAGRCSDAASIAALPIMRGLPPGPAWHGAKIGECGALCATNPQSGVIVIEFDEAGFTIIPTADGACATPHTVSAHMLYENSDPLILYEPGGHLDVSAARYTALDDKRVRVSGSRWEKAKTYTVKLEGARVAGFQVVSLALLRDPRYVAAAESWAADIRGLCVAKVCDRLQLSDGDFSIELRLIGQNATFGTLETRTGDPVEIGVLAIVTAATAGLAREIAKMLNPYLLHHPLTQGEEQPTFAFPFSPPEMGRGAVFEFCLNHVLELSDPMDAFSLEVITHG